MAETQKVIDSPSPETAVAMVLDSRGRSRVLESDTAYWMAQAQLAQRRMAEYDEVTWQLARTAYAPTLNDDEFVLFVQHAKRQGLDPVQRQIYAYVSIQKNTGKRELVFIAGVHGLLARCYRVPTFLGIQGEAVYDGDTGGKGVIVNAAEGVVQHDFQMVDRGNLIGAWARGQHRGRLPIVKASYLAQYVKTGEIGFFWRQFPDVMIEKIPRAQIARELVPEEGGALYVAEEFSGVSLPDGTVAMPHVTTAGALPKARRPESAAERAAKPHVALLREAKTEAELSKARAEINKAWKLIGTEAQMLIKAAGEEADKRLGITREKKGSTSSTTPPATTTSSEPEPPPGEAIDWETGKKV